MHESTTTAVAVPTSRGGLLVAASVAHRVLDNRLGQFVALGKRQGVRRLVERLLRGRHDCGLGGGERGVATCIIFNNHFK